MKLQTFSALSATALLMSSAALAASQDAPVPSATAPAEPLHVTAPRIPIAIDRLAASVTLLDKAAIDRAGDFDMAHLLERTPGVSITRTGGQGTVSTVRIRGSESSHVVIVLDGVKVNNPSTVTGDYDFSNLLVGDAARVEVLRGPQSTLWGSQAIGGVINIVTPLPEKELEGSFDIEAGTHETISARAALGGKSGPLSWRIAGQSFSTNGISAIAPEFGGEETDGYTNRSLQGRMEVELTPDISLDFRGHYSDGHADFDDFDSDAPNFARTKEFVGYAGLNIALLDGRFRNRFGFGHTNSKSRNFDPRQERQLTYDANGRNQRFEYQGSFAFTPDITAIFGAEHEKSSFHSVSPFGPPSIPIPDPTRGTAKTTSGYGQIIADVVAGLTLTAGIRHDDHSRFGGKTLFSAGGAWRLPTGTTLRANYGDGFKAPSLYQLFSDYGNEGLAPERAHGWEAGIEQTLADDLLRVGVTYFERRTRNEIIFASCLPGTTDPLCTDANGQPRWGYYDNAARTKARGIEAEAQLAIGALTLGGNYSWINTRNNSEGDFNQNNWLPRRPHHMANGSIDYSLSFGLDIGASVRWSGKRYEDAANMQQLDAYTTVDLRAEFKVAPEFSVLVRANNLLDEKYMTAWRYGTLGRTITAGLRGRF